MTDLHPRGEAEEHVVVVHSRPAGEARSFRIDPGTIGDAPSLPEVKDEDSLVAWMQERDYRLTMVGGGGGTADARRLYFRPR